MQQHTKSKDAEVREAAKKYVDRQLDVLKQHGSVSRITKSDYEIMVRQVVKVSAK